MKRTSDYKFDGAIFRVTYDSLTTIVADALVSSDDSYLTMGGGVSLALLNAGGPEIAHETRKHVPAKIGDVVVTSAGRLGAKFIFHAITIDYRELTYPSDESIRAATLRCLELADALGVRTLAFPALGTGVGGYPFQRAARTMTRTVAEYLLSNETCLELVTIALLAREGVSGSDLNIFYEQAVGLATVLAHGDRLQFLLTDLCKYVERIGDPGLLRRVRELEVDILSKQEDAVKTAGPISATGDEQPQLDALAAFSQRAVGFATDAAADAHWGDRQLDAEIARTKLQGLLTQLNIKQSHLNRFEIEKAKYGGVGTPPRLEIAIEELTNDMRELENTVNHTRKHLANSTG